MKIFILRIVTILFVFFATSSYGAVRVDSNKLYEEGMNAYNSQDYEKSVNLLEKAIKAGLSGDKLQAAKRKIQSAKNVITIPPNTREELADFYKQYKKLLSNQNFDEIKKMIHPQCLACVNPRFIYSFTEGNFNELSDQKYKKETIEFQLFHQIPPPPDYLGEKEKEMYRRMYFPVLPKYILSAMYEYDSGGVAVRNFYVTNDDGSWKITEICMKLPDAAAFAANNWLQALKNKDLEAYKNSLSSNAIKRMATNNEILETFKELSEAVIKYNIKFTEQIITENYDTIIIGLTPDVKGRGLFLSRENGKWKVD